MESFGPQLRKALQRQQQRHHAIVARLRWPVSPTYDADAWAAAWEAEVPSEESDPQHLSFPAGKPLTGAF